MHSLHNTRSVKVMYQLFCLCPILCCIDKLHFPFTRNFHLSSLVYIAVRMSCNGNRFLPVFYARFDPFYYNWGTKNCTVKNRTDGTVRALPHFFEIILFHARCIWSDRSAFDRYFILLCRIRRVHCHLVICLIAVLQPQVIILGF